MNFVSLISSFFITGISLYALKPMAGKVGLMDIPGGRKTHSSATPMVGGIGIYFGTLTMCFFTAPVLAEYAGLLAVSAFVLAVGLMDDVNDMKASLRMVLHSFAALAMIFFFDVRLESLGDLFGRGELQLGMMAVPITVFATLGVINAINMADGVDGLSGSMVISSLIMLAIVSWTGGDIAMLGFIVVLSCAVLAFLTLNYRRPWKKRALVYLGDAGSTMLGFMLAWLVIKSSQSPAGISITPAITPVVALWFLALPLFDTVNLLIKRPLRGQSPFAAGQDHFHHILSRKGLKPEHIVVVMVLISLSFGLFGLLAHYAQYSETFMFQLFLLLFVSYFFVTRYLEQNHKLRLLG